MKWINIKEKLPEHGETVYLWLVPFLGKPYETRWTWDKQDSMNLRINGDKVTHWIKFESPKD